MVKSFLKCYLDENYKNSLMFHYCHIRLNDILPSNYSLHDAAPLTTPYYATIINIIQRILHIPNFPYIPKVKIYESMFIEEKSLAELQYPTFNWQNIWKNHSSLFILSFDKEIIYKHLHMCLSTNNRLFMLNLTDSSNCQKCRAERVETPLHMLYECNYVTPIFLWVLRCLLTLCNFKPLSNIRFIYFDNLYNSRIQKTICNTFIYIYIITIWRNRKENLRIGDLKVDFIRKLDDYMNFIKHMPNHRFEKLSGELSVIDIETLLDL